MTPGPILIMKAPGCKKPLKFRTIGSGNTFGATLWTDGKMEAPMLPDQPLLMKSPSEGVLFWRKECEQIGSIETYPEKEQEPEEWKDLEYAENPTEEDYFRALDGGVAQTGDQTKYLRLRLWWAGNDPIRRDAKLRLSREHLDNLNAFLELLSPEDPSQRLLKAEVLRELGRFKEAAHVLFTDFPEKYYRAKSCLLRLVANRKRKVQKRDRLA